MIVVARHDEECWRLPWIVSFVVRLRLEVLNKDKLLASEMEESSAGSSQGFLPGRGS